MEISGWQVEAGVERLAPQLNNVESALVPRKRYIPLAAACALMGLLSLSGAATLVNPGNAEAKSSPCKKSSATPKKPIATCVKQPPRR